MKIRIAVLALAVLLLTSCASAPLPGASPTSNFSKLVRAVFDGKVSLSDTQIEGITAGGRSVAEAVVAARSPGFEGIVALALGGKAYKAGWLLDVIPQGQVEPVEILCPPAMAEKCAGFGPNVAVMVYATPVPIGAEGTGPLLLLRRISE